MVIGAISAKQFINVKRGKGGYPVKVWGQLFY